MRIEQTAVFARWLRKLKDLRARTQIVDRLETIEETGHFGDHKSLGAGIYELRIFAGPGYRLYYTMRGKTVVLLLVGGDKGCQERDIERARRLARMEKD